MYSPHKYRRLIPVINVYAMDSETVQRVKKNTSWNYEFYPQDAGSSYLVSAGLKPLDADLDAQAGELLLVAVRHGDITPIYM
jgi:hypothetical protein